MRALLDTDIILDVLLERQPFFPASQAVWQAHEDGQFDGYMAAITPLNVFYIARRQRDDATARQLLGDLLATFSVCPLDHAILHAAYTLPITDFEDAVQHTSATTMHLDAIVTRNGADYANATLPVFAPAEFLAYLAQQTNADYGTTN